jgi:hypothetical protein
MLFSTPLNLKVRCLFPLQASAARSLPLCQLNRGFLLAPLPPKGTVHIPRHTLAIPSNPRQTSESRTGRAVGVHRTGLDATNLDISGLHCLYPICPCSTCLPGRQLPAGEVPNQGLPHLTCT